MKILFAGEGGQGVQLAAEILAYSAFLEGKKASTIPNFGVEQRGGVSLAYVTIGEGNYPKFEKADILAIFSQRSWERVKPYLSAATQVILGPGVKAEKVPEVSRVIHSRGGSLLTPRVWNIMVLGKVNSLGKIVSLESLQKAMEERLANQFKKNPELRKLNLEALEK